MKYLSKREIEPFLIRVREWDGVRNELGREKTPKRKTFSNSWQNDDRKRIGRHFRKEDILRFSFIYVMCLTVKCLHARIIHTIVGNDNGDQGRMKRMERKNGKNGTNEAKMNKKEKEEEEKKTRTPRRELVTSHNKYFSYLFPRAVHTHLFGKVIAR